MSKRGVDELTMKNWIAVTRDLTLAKTHDYGAIQF